MTLWLWKMAARALGVRFLRITPDEVVIKLPRWMTGAPKVDARLKEIETQGEVLGPVTVLRSGRFVRVRKAENG